MRISSGTGRQPQYALVFAGEHQATIKKAGWSREDVQRYCFENSKSTVAELKRISIMSGDVKPEDERTLHPWWKSRGFAGRDKAECRGQSASFRWGSNRLTDREQGDQGRA